MNLSDLILSDGRVTFPDGTLADDGVQPDCHGLGRGGITVRGPLSYFGGGSQDIMKVSSQGHGGGTVLLACNPTVTDYEPLNLRGETITLQYRIPDPDDATGHSTMSLPGLVLDTSGNVNVINSLNVSGAVVAHYFLGDPAGYGYRFNNANNSVNLVTIEEDGRLRIPALAGGGVRPLKVDNGGYLVV